MSFEGLVGSNIMCKALDGSDGGDERDDEASPAEDLEPHPVEGVFGELGLRNVHLYGEVDRQGVERGRPDEPQEPVEEGEDHRHHRRHHHVRAPPHQPEQVEPVVPHERHVLRVYELALRPSLAAVLLHEPEYGLCKHLFFHNLFINLAFIMK